MTRITTWNVEGRLSGYVASGRGSAEHIVHSIKELDADIIFLPEAFGVHRADENITDQHLLDMGYNFYDIPYQDGGPIRDPEPVMGPRLRLMSKIKFESTETVRLGDLRNCIVATICDSATNTIYRVIGIHLDDRSEAFRQNQLQDLIPTILSSDMPTVMLGDYNAMHGTTAKARFLRSHFAERLINFLPVESLRSLGERAIEMAEGSILSAIESETTLRDADSHFRPTTTPKGKTHPWLPSVRLLDIDHIMLTPDITNEDFHIASKDMGADHRPVSVSVSFDS